MTRDQLEHAIRAACDVSKDTELWIFGSQAILGEFPNAPESLRASIEVDVQPKNRPETVDDVDGALGELSMFHQTHGFCVHGILITSAKLPAGWQQRTIPVSDPIATHGKTGLCIEAHDLAKFKRSAERASSSMDKNYRRRIGRIVIISPQSFLHPWRAQLFYTICFIMRTHKHKLDRLVWCC